MRRGGRGVRYGMRGNTLSSPIFTGTGGSGYPIILASSWAAVASTNVTTEEALATITIPANAMGANGIIRLTASFTAVNSANVKTARVRYSAIGGTAIGTLTLTSVGGSSNITLILGNRGATNSQACAWIAANQGGNVIADSGGEITTAVDTTAATNIILTSQKATGTDAMSLRGYTAELIKP